MAVVRVSNTLQSLADDTEKVATTAKPEFARAVRHGAELGTRLAKSNAKRSAGTHGKHYPDAITSEALSSLSWVYGPDASLPQGGMSFEHGSRNQPAHLDLAKSADLAGPSMQREVGNLLGYFFWAAGEDE